MPSCPDSSSLRLGGTAPVLAEGPKRAALIIPEACTGGESPSTQDRGSTARCAFAHLLSSNGCSETRMNYHTYFGVGDRTVQTCIVGTGDFGRSFLGQGRRAPLIGARIAVDVSAERAAEAWRSVGAEANEIAVCGAAPE